MTSRDEGVSLGEHAMRRRMLLFVAMIAAVFLVAAVLYWDEQREQEATLVDFANEQVDRAHDAMIVQRDRRAELETPGEVLVIAQDDHGALMRPNGSNVRSDAIAGAIASGVKTARLSRPEAAALGLPERMAVLGISRGDGGAVVVVATAHRTRDRGFRAQKRLLLGVGLAALLVAIFGTIALGLQRREYALEQDLLARRRAHHDDERLARADKLATMGALMTGIAHEIATPLGVIWARAEALTSDDARAVRAKQTILEQTDKIRGIVKSFLALARGEPAESTTVTTRALVDSAVHMVQHRFETAHVGIDVDVEREIPAVFGDARLLEQALVNLLLNACEASTRDGRVHVYASHVDDRVVIVVDDDGEGIGPEAATHATEAFFTTKSAGTGLGLAIVSEIIKHHQGRFIIEPRTPHGTRATLDLPAAGTKRPATNEGRAA